MAIGSWWIGSGRDIERHRGAVTLLLGARDVDHDEAQVLLEVLASHSKHVHH